MPKKIRELKQALSQAGFQWRPAKGSHQVWYHPSVVGLTVTIAGKDGDDARRYLEKEVRIALRQFGRSL